MRVRFLGHACFELRSAGGLSILLDPYRPGALGGRIRHGPIGLAPDIVCVSHFHEDHGWIGGVPGEPVIVDRTMTSHGVEFRAITTYHDGDEGCRMGMNRMLLLELDGVSALHPGDLGALPGPDTLAALGPVDLLLLPVGGRFTLDVPEAVEFMETLLPSWTVPMHYRSEQVDLAMGTRDDFLAGLPADTTIITGWDGDTSGAGGGAVVLMEPER